MYIIILKCLFVCFSIGFSFDLPRTNMDGLFVGNMFPVICAILYGFLLVRKRENEKFVLIEKICINGLGILFALFWVLSQIEVVMRFDSMLMCLLSFGISSIGIFLFCKIIIENIVWGLSSDDLIVNANGNIAKPIYTFVGTLVILLLSWGISFLVLYPGIFGVDSLENLEQAIGTRNMDVLFPFYMTLFLRFCWNTGLTLWGSGNAGIALYAAIQLVVMATVVSYMIFRIYKCNVKLPICIIMLLYFIILPYHAQCSVMIFKDTPYAIGTLLVMQLLWEYYVFGESDKRYQRIAKAIVLIMACILMAMSRANGFYVFVLCVPFFLLVFYKKSKKVVLYVLMAVTAVIVVRGPLFDYIITVNNELVKGPEVPVYDIRYRNMDVEISGELESDILATKGSTMTTVSNASASYGASGVFIITAQQLGRVAVDRELSDEEYKKLSTVINVEEMKETYNPYIVTNAMNQINNYNTSEYLKVWIEFGFKYPYSYFMAWKDQTSGYWDPLISSGGNDLDFCEKNKELYADGKMPDFVEKLYYKWNDTFPRQMPVVALLWSNGFLLWVTLGAVALTIIKRNISSSVFYLPLIGLWLTLLVGNPCNASFRYFYSFYLCLPLTLIIPFIKGKHEDDNV